MDFSHPQLPETSAEIQSTTHRQPSELPSSATTLKAFKRSKTPSSMVSSSKAVLEQMASIVNEKTQ